MRSSREQDRLRGWRPKWPIKITARLVLAAISTCWCDPVPDHFWICTSPSATVYECLESAQKNIIIPLKTEDPLLTSHASDGNKPADRYQTVEAMQEAISRIPSACREHQQTERSELLLVKRSHRRISSDFRERFLVFKRQLSCGQVTRLRGWPRQSPTCLCSMRIRKRQL